MELTISELESRFLESLTSFKVAPSFSKKDKKSLLLSHADMLCRTAEGITFLYKCIGEADEAGLFEDSVWVEPRHLVPFLVGGTLLAGYPISTMEILSELRLLAIAENRIENPAFPAEQARAFLEDMLVANFVLAYEDFSERAWEAYAKGELEKIRLLFGLIHQHISLESLKPKVADAIEVLSAHRPIVVTKIKRMLAVIDKQVRLDESHPEDQRLLQFVNALYRPTSKAREEGSPQEYRQWLEQSGKAKVKAESKQIGAQMAEIELHANQVATLVQASFESQMGDWARKSLFLNFLLTIGSFSFIIILLLVSYGIFLLFRQQSNHQDTLRTSEQRLRVILDAIPDAVYRVSGAGIYTDYKPAINQAHRLPETTFFRKHLRDVLPPAVATAMENGIKTVLAEQQPLLLDYPLVDARHNLTRHYEARLLPSGVDEVQIIVRDVTEVKQQEEATIQAQKLESLGVLAGGIAHDFNNLLTGMLGQASLAVAKLNRGLPALDHVEKVVLSAERAADLTKQLLAYTGKGKFQIDLLDLNRLITDTTALMGTVIPGGTDLRLALQDPLPPVRVDRGQIQQVAMNLFINAIEALPDGNGSIVAL